MFQTSGNSQHEPEDPNRTLVIAVCVLISATLWLTLTLDEQRTVVIDIPTQVVNLPPDRALTSLPPEAVRVELKGQGLQLILLRLNPPEVAVDVSNSPVDVRSALAVPETQNIQVVSVSPQQIDVPTETRTERRLPIRSKVTVDMPRSYEMLGPLRLRPDSVTISGARSIVESFASWPTKAITLDDVRDSVRVQVPLSDTLDQLLERSISSVAAVAQAGRFTEDSLRVDVEVSGVPSDQNLVALEPSVITVKYRVLFEHTFEAKTAPGFFATVSYEEIRSDTSGFVEPEITVPSDLQIRDPKPFPQRLRYYTFVTGE
ncbi:CdaR family protein [Longibacter salinarum]|uniref:CdaR family protein n=1 Tax=Longibacter salinarum TaxID=1850348 RepID=UPI0011810244|nr:CdaR family protein [Longibacter salinarum]